MLQVLKHPEGDPKLNKMSAKFTIVVLLGILTALGAETQEFHGPAVNPYGSNLVVPVGNLASEEDSVSVRFLACLSGPCDDVPAVMYLGVGDYD